MRPEQQSIDDWTGFKVPHRCLKKQWDGVMSVDPDRRNPQDLIRARPERPAAPDPRPEAEDTFLATNTYDANGLPVIDGNGNPVLTAGQTNGTGL